MLDDRMRNCDICCNVFTEEEAKLKVRWYDNTSMRICDNTSCRKEADRQYLELSDEIAQRISIEEDDPYYGNY
jgi:hypothetical protein